MFDKFDTSKFNTEMFDAFKIDADVIADRYASVSTTVLDAVVEAQHKLVDAWINGADKLVEVIPVDLPSAFPAPAETGAKYLDFVERAATVNREWNARVVNMLRTGDVDHLTTPIVDAATSMTETITDTISEAVSKVTPAAAPGAKAPAAKTPAKKAPAKKAPAKKAAAKKAPARRPAAK